MENLKLQPNFAIISETITLAPAGIFRGGGSEVQQRRGCKGGRCVWGAEPQTPEKFSKSFKNQFKNLQFFENVKENLPFFQIFSKILSNFPRKLWQKLE